METVVIKEEKDLIEVTNVQGTIPTDFDVKVKVENDILEKIDWCTHTSENSFHDVNSSVGYDDLIKFNGQKCLFCNQDFKNSYSLYQHNLTHLTIQLDILNITLQEDHNSSKHEEQVNPECNDLITKSLRECHICRKIFKYKIWHSHMRTVHSKVMYKCLECDAKFKCKRYLRRHLVRIHDSVRLKWTFPQGNSKNITCEHCSATLNCLNAYTTHLRNVHSRGFHECNICKSTFKCAQYLRTHTQRVHYNDGKIHMCECGKSFRSPRYLKVHQKYSGH